MMNKKVSKKFGVSSVDVGLSVGSNGGMPVLLDQVQADWTETDETSKAFIKNKPVVEDPIKVKILGESKI
ncbi:MAG: hypothetical protein IKW25_03125 [Phascolarctobacterium sp.]|nr:hypothetical protein [Phascolarctobacterium sp.]